jgi:hypothetical protein
MTAPPVPRPTRATPGTVTSDGIFGGLTPTERRDRRRLEVRAG